MNKKRYIILISICIAIIIIILWINGTIPKQIAKIYGTSYMKIRFPKMQLEYINVEWSKADGDYVITFKDNDNENYGCVIGPKYFPVSMGQGLFGITEEYREKYDNQNKIIDNNINIEIKTGTLTKQGATIIITNKNNYKVRYEEWFRIDKKQNEKWRDVEIINKGHIFNALGYSINGESNAEERIDWSNLYGELSNGEYRLIKKVDGRNITVEFTID